jgi:hypothetical protein
VCVQQGATAALLWESRRAGVLIPPHARKLLLALYPPCAGGWQALSEEEDSSEEGELEERAPVTPGYARRGWGLHCHLSLAPQRWRSMGRSAGWVLSGGWAFAHTLLTRCLASPCAALQTV